MDDKYLGCANYETWAVGLWLNNDQGLYYQVREMAEQARDNVPVCPQVLRGVWSPDQAAVFLLADEIKSMVVERSPLVNDASMFDDLLTHALSRVEWTEIAESVLESLPEEEDEDD